MGWQEVLKDIPSQVEVLVATKEKSAEFLNDFLKNPQFPRLFGENYAQELVEKKEKLKEHAIRWHFIGALQTKKIKSLVNTVDCLESISKEKHVEELIKLALPDHFKFLIQVNTSKEASKAGFFDSEVETVVKKINQSVLKKHWNGFFCLPSPLEDVGEVQLRAEFKILKKLRDQFLPDGVLSMGTSSDYKIAIEEGATRIRLGTLILGQR